jgi:hypothetical protein
MGALDRPGRFVEKFGVQIAGLGQGGNGAGWRSAAFAAKRCRPRVRRLAALSGQRLRKSAPDVADRRKAAIDIGERL